MARSPGIYLTCHAQRHLMLGCLWMTLGCQCSEADQWSPQSHQGSVLSWSAPSLAGGSFSPGSLVTTVHYVADQNAPKVSLLSVLRPTQLPTALGVLSDVCWGHPSQRGTVAPLLVQAQSPGAEPRSSLQCWVRQSTGPSALATYSPVPNMSLSF